MAVVVSPPELKLAAKVFIQFEGGTLVEVGSVILPVVVAWPGMPDGTDGANVDEPDDPDEEDAPPAPEPLVPFVEWDGVWDAGRRAIKLTDGSVAGHEGAVAYDAEVRLRLGRCLAQLGYGQACWLNRDHVGGHVGRCSVRHDPVSARCALPRDHAAPHRFS